MKSTAIYCRYCHQRLFDMVPGSKGSIEIKCSRCRRIIRITFSENQVKEAWENSAREL